MSLRAMAQAFAAQMPDEPTPLPASTVSRLAVTSAGTASTAPAAAGAAPTQSAPATATGAASGAQSLTIASIASAITFWIPNETIVVYALFISFFGTDPWSQPSSSGWFIQSASLWLALVVVACTIVSPVIVFFTTRQETAIQTKKGKRKRFKAPYFGMIASVIGFLAWATYLPNSVIAHTFNIPYYGSVGVLVVVQLCLYVAGLALGLNPPAPVPTEAQREGQVDLGLSGGGGEGNVRAVHGDLADGVDGAAGAPTPVSAANPSVVIANAAIVPVFMGDDWKTSTLSGLRTNCISFLNAYVSGPTFDALKFYQVQSGTVLKDQDIALPTAASGVVTSTQIETQLATLVPTIASANTIVMVVFCPPSINAQNGTDTTCTTCCGFHSRFTVSGMYVPYSVIPYADHTCPACSTTRSFPASIMSSAAHELCEMLTNPNPVAQDGYIAANGDEIADLCQGPANDPNSYAGFYVQQICINGSCALPA